jgi:hypothetical protein
LQDLLAFSKHFSSFPIQLALHEPRSISLAYKFALQVALQVLLIRLQSWFFTQDLQPSDISLIEVLADANDIKPMENKNKPIAKKCLQLNFIWVPLFLLINNRL